MTDEQARILFVEYLYGEIDEEQKINLERYLEAHPEIKLELNALHDVRDVLTKYPAEQPDAQLVMVPTRPSGFSNLWQNFIRIFIPQNEVLRTAYALAVCLILIITLGASFNMQLNYSNNGFSMAFGEKKAVQEETITPEQLSYLLEQVKKENALMMSEFIRTAQEQQNQNIEMALEEFAQYMEQRRLSDLQLISADLSTLQATYYNKFNETDRVLGKIIQTVQEN